MKYTRYRSVPSLRTGQSHQAGRNSTGHITVRHRGGGHKQAFRSIDWNRSRAKALVVSFEYDPQRNASLAKLYHPKSVQSTPSQPTYSYIIAPTGLKLFQEVYSYNNKQVTTSSPDNSATVAKLLLPGDSAPISFFEPGDFIHAVEAFPGQGAVFGRSSGSFCQVMSLQQDSALLNTENTATNFAKVRLPSGSQRLINFGASATLGVPTSRDNPKKNLKKAGRSRWLGWRPSVRGVAMNPVDHPHGGGQGKTSGGRPSVTFKSWPTKGRPTRGTKRRNLFILTPCSK